MGEAKRKTYPASFKAKVGLEAIRGVKTANEIGQDHGVKWTPCLGQFCPEFKLVRLLQSQRFGAAPS